MRGTTGGRMLGTAGDRTRRHLAAMGLQPARPTLDLLTRIHRAHVARFPHDTIWMVRGRVPALTEEALVDALLAGEGGACMQLNVAMWTLLRDLGYDVTLHSATAQSTFQLEASQHHGDHCVMTVALPEGRFLVDVGTGTGHLEPLPLAPGTWVQGGFEYTVHDLGGRGWRIAHDRRPRALRAVELTLDPVELASFEPLYSTLATDPASPYRLTPWAQRRTDEGVEMLHLRTLRIRRPEGWEVVHLTSAEEWFEQMTGRFGLRLPDLSSDELTRVWDLTGAERTRPASS